MFAEKRSFIYSVAVLGDVVLSGSGDGMLLAHSLNADHGHPKCGGGSGGDGGVFLGGDSSGVGGGLLWGLGASSMGAVRCVGGSTGRVVAASDDGSALVWAMPQ